MLSESPAYPPTKAESNDRKTIHNALTGWLAAPSVRPVVRILEGKRPASEHPAFFKEVPRLIVILDFIRCFRRRFGLTPGAYRKRPWIDSMLRRSPATP
ncbi:MAG: hypothetical protein ACREH8_09000 [Opitutaceae bacterium]